MKNRKYMLLISIIIIIMNAGKSCTDLDEIIYDQIAVEDFGKTQEQVNALIGPIYSTLKDYNITWDSYVTMVEVSSDMMVIPERRGGDWWDDGMYKVMMEHQWTASSEGYSGVYGSIMQNISLCNQIYYQITLTTSITGERKEEVLAEIRGVRAFWYYILVDAYGNVPIVTDFLDVTQPFTKSRKEVYEFVISELNEIKDKLRDDGANASSYGKFTKGAACTLLAKMYLNAEVWNPDGGPKWDECVEACDEVLALSYSLESNWKTNFIVHNEVSNEAILSAVFKAGGSGVPNELSLNTLHWLDDIALGLNVEGWNGICAAPNYVKAFDEEDIRYHGSFLIGAMLDPLTGDTIMTDDGRPLVHYVDITMHDVEDGWGWVNTEDGARCFKWEFEAGLSISMENDFHIFRLADVYLMKAEALVRGGGDNAEATELVNALRRRAFDDDPAKLLSNVTLDDIYKERRFELAWEGYTRQDMIRFGTFLLPRDFKPWQSDPKYLLYPIPQQDLDANSNLIQNPGY
jgi:hypothetical protein